MHKSVDRIALHLPKITSGSREKGGGRFGGLGGESVTDEAGLDEGKREAMKDDDRSVEARTFTGRRIGTKALAVFANWKASVSVASLIELN